MIRCVIYVRQSVNAPEGIERGLTASRALAAQRGWDVVHEYKDNDTSAWKTRAKGTDWDAMLSGWQAGQFEYVVGVDLDRLIRTMRDLQTLVDLKVQIVTTSGQVDLTTADGIMRAQIMTSAAEFEMRRKGERQVRAADFRATQGRPHAGRRPFGWEKDRVTVRESEAKWVRQATAWLIAGISVHQVAARLNDAGAVPAETARWNTTLVRKMVVRARNAGLLERKGVIQEVSQINGIVSREDWQMVVDLLMARSTPASRGPVPTLNWLSGILTCSVCGSAMHSKKVNSRSGLTRTYICSALDKQGLRHVSLVADTAERHVTDFMFGWLAAGPDEETPDDVRHVQRQIVDLVAQRAAATDAAMLPGADMARIRTRLAEVTAALEAAEARRAELAADTSSLRAVLADMELPEDFADADPQPFRDAWEKVAHEQRRALIRTSLNLTVLKGGKGAKRLRILPK